MKQILEPVVTVTNEKTESTANNKQQGGSTGEDLLNLQIQRSYLPDSVDKPVHKCGCT